jgi:hypothetical protein
MPNSRPTKVVRYDSLKTGSRTSGVKYLPEVSNGFTTVVEQIRAFE